MGWFSFSKIKSLSYLLITGMLKNIGIKQLQNVDSHLNKTQHNVSLSVLQEELQVESELW